MIAARLRPRARRLRALAVDRGGVTAIEFALAAPVLFLLMFGTYDIGHTAYVIAVLRGAVQDVARDATLEDASTTDEDAYVTKIIQGVAPNATVTTTRQSYYDFADIARAEQYNDKNGDGTCDNGETYTDENGNGQWDSDIGVSGNGGADDVVLYTVTVTYKPLIAIPLLGNANGTRTFTAKAVQKNQPYATQTTYGTKTGTCT